MESVTIELLLDKMVERNGSDLYLNVGSPPSMRVDGKVLPFDLPILDKEAIEDIIDQVLNVEQRSELASALELNIAFSSGSEERFRGSFYYQQHFPGIVIRYIKSVIPGFEELNLPQSFGTAVMQKRGLVLIVGATGAGKSTSIASMLEYRNNLQSSHIITVEDPIEFVHTPKKCIFTQREIGTDTFSYSIALKNAMRQSPDILVIGEIRDRETLENALLFSETGHLVITCIHASNATQALERILNFFPEDMHQQVLLTLSQNLYAIFSQRLVAGEDNRRWLAYETVLNQGLVRDLIQKGEINKIHDVVAKNHDQGMNTFDQCLHSMANSGLISKDSALLEADNPSNLRLSFTQDGFGTSGNYNIRYQHSEKTGD